MYAAGEVALVIIGIMIAVGLNNSNEARKQDKQIQSILKQIQVELTETIEESNDLIEYFRQKDSLIYLAMKNKVTREAYEDPNNGALRSIYMNYDQLILQEDGFNNLMQKSEIMPDKYLTLVKSLKKLYINSNDAVKEFNQKLSSLVDDAQAQLRDNYDWYADWAFSGSLNNEMVDYYLNDIVHKNNLERYSNIAIGNLTPYIINVRIDAIKSIREIDALLETNNTYSFDVNGADYADWNGKYHYQGDTLEFANNEDGVRWLNEGEWQEVYPLSSSQFHYVWGGFCQMTKDENGETDGIKFHLSKINITYQKIKAND